jgi:hypothetical protein
LLNALFLPRCSCCFRPQSIKPLLHSGFGRRFSPNVRPLGVPSGTSSLPCPLRLCPLRRATHVRRVTPLSFGSEIVRPFGGTYYLSLQGRRVSQARDQLAFFFSSSFWFLA